MEKLEKEKYRMRTSAKRVFARLNTSVNKSMEKCDEVELVEELFTELKDSWAKLQHAHDEYTATKEEEAEVDWIEDLYETYNNTQRKFFMYKKEMKPKEKIKLQLKPVDLPKFSGNMREYPRFKLDFIQQVMAHTDEQSAAFTLRMCLSKHVQEKVTLVADDVDAIFEKLDEEYGDPSAVTDVVINDIKTFQVKGRKSLLDFIDVIERGHHDLACLGMTKEISNSGVVSIIESKLPDEERRKWAERVNAEGSLVPKMDKFPHLLKFLQEVRRTLKYLHAELRDGHSPKQDVPRKVLREVGRSIIQNRLIRKGSRKDL